MGLSNAASRARNYGRTINANQGGGDKKAGLPYQIGREWRTSIAFGASDIANGSCCSLKKQMTMAFTPSRYQARPIGGNVTVAQSYYSPV